MENYVGITQKWSG